MPTKYVFVGDIHGKVEFVEKALAMDGTIIFMGDFMDSYDRHPAQHALCLRLVCDAIASKKARSVYGNHELSYLMTRHRCSGYDPLREQVMHQFKDEISELFEPHIMLAPDFLITHAGVTRRLWDEHGLTLENLDAKLTEWWHDTTSPVHYVGHARGGFDRYGGTFWCDYNREFKPVPGLTQVFGHTRGMGIRQVEDSYCIDCLDTTKEFLELDV